MNSTGVRSALLALDTSQSGCSAALFGPEGLIDQSYQPTERNQAEILMPLCLGLLEQANLHAQDLGALAVSRGPGSFTGIRAGLATAQGWGLAAGIPAYGLDCFLSYAYAAQTGPDQVLPSTLFVLIESKREDFYAQKFVRKSEPGAVFRRTGEPFLIQTHDLLNLTRNQGGDLGLFGNACHRLRNEQPDLSPFIYPGANAHNMAACLGRAVRDHFCGHKLLKSMDPDNPEIFSLHPLYIRPPDVSISIA